MNYIWYVRRISDVPDQEIFPVKFDINLNMCLYFYNKNNYVLLKNCIIQLLKKLRFEPFTDPMSHLQVEEVNYHSK